MNYQQGNTPVTPPSDNVTCTLITPPLPATTPIMDCKVILPTGNNVSIYTSDFSATNANSYQTINDVATTDSTPPTAT